MLDNNAWIYSIEALKSPFNLALKSSYCFELVSLTTPTYWSIAYATSDIDSSYLVSKA